MAYPLFLNDIVKLASHSADSPHRLRTPLSSSSAERLKFLIFLAEKLGILSSMGNGWRAGKRFSQFLEGEPGLWWKEFYDAFLREDEWDELPLVVKLKSMGERPSPSQARAFILKNLREGETQEEFSLRLKRKFPDFYRRSGTWKLRKGGITPSWEELEGRIISMIIRELQWINVLHQGESINFTEGGKALKKGEIPELSVERPLAKPDFEVIAPLNVHHRDIFFLEKVAEPLSAQQVYTYRLSRDSVMKAMESGMKPGEIVERMEEWSPLPENLRENILRWGARFSKIKLRFGVVIEVEDPHLLQELMHLRRLKDLLIPLSPKYALTKTENMEEVRRLLRSGEYYAEIPREWDGKKLLFLSKEEAEALKKFLQPRVDELKFPYNVIIEEVMEKL